jgi:hypothetical protein
LQDFVTKYKGITNKKISATEFKEGDLVWIVLTKDRFMAGEYNKLLAQKIE